MSQPVELLVADDSRQDCDLLAIAARATNLVPTFVYTREAVVPALDADLGNYRAILLDVNMGEQSLDQLVANIRAHRIGSTLLVIAMSDLAPSAGGPIASAAGVERFVQKPASLVELESFLQGLESELGGASTSNAIT